MQAEQLRERGSQTACVRVSRHEQESVSDMEKTRTEAAGVVFRGCCACSASVLRVRARTERVEQGGGTTRRRVRERIQSGAKREEPWRLLQLRKKIQNS